MTQYWEIQGPNEEELFWTQPTSSFRKKKKKKYYMGWYEYLNCKYSNISPTHKQTSLVHFPLEQINKKDYISDPHVKIQSY